ncbi:S-methyl-5-thioribose-1-phosphate isomerase [Thermoleophilum album]|uniref:S-methyl-5-thioribose-1-phosphate isomerase n=1 Tax=Thermoleophilum album TaxID=29539 RepID=UPI00237D289E|nr:S-methyl-5-thioribose-1-phosphate isomerase [Thermoleophilum album]WDT94022.1 S-methyl-5-thioribose-1-phosphate isomerase [Thermoleophilum album]
MQAATESSRSFIRRRYDALEVLDQRALPEAERWLVLRTPADTVTAIKELAIRGAPAIGIAAAHAIALAAREGPKSARHAAQLLAAARPTAVNLRWACERMTAALERALAEGRDPARALAAEADAIDQEQRRADRAIATHGASLVPDGARVLTICNTGALATGGEGTALAIALEAHRQGRVREVLALETRPLLQGARLTCWELERAGVPHRLLCDSAAGAAFASGLVDCVLVGADRIARNGDVANKIGTYPLAVLAERHDVPFYVAAPTSTIDTATASGTEIPIEQRPEEEVLGFGAVATAPPGTRAWNPAFDVTPAALVAAIVCERGIARPPYDRSLAALVDSTAGEQLSRAGARR